MRGPISVPDATGPRTATPEPDRLDGQLLQAQLMAYARDLRTALRRSRDATHDLAQTHLETVAALAAAVDVRDEITGGHVYRVANYGAILSETMAPALRDDPQLVYGFLLHDIGKLAVPDAILGKAGPLTPPEQRVMRSHVEHGIRLVKGVSFLRPALTIIATHHERFDGSGYPQGIRGEEIPLAARMFSVCDTFDAMVHDRPYRRALTTEQATEELRRCAGTQFDPEIVEGFEASYDRMLEVEERPPVPGQTAAIRSARRTRDADLVATKLFDSVDQAMVLISPEGAIREANHGFLRMFDLVDPPVGMMLHEVVRRSRAPQQHVDDLRLQLLRLERDLFHGRRQGAARLGDHDLRWFSNVIQGEGTAVVGRIVVLEEIARAPAYDLLRHARDELVRSLPTSDELALLLDAPAPDDPRWVERTRRLRDGLERVRGLTERLESETEALLGADESFDVQHPEATPFGGEAR